MADADKQSDGGSGPRIERLDPAIRELINRSLHDEEMMALLLHTLNSEPRIVAPLADGPGPPRLTLADIEEWRRQAFPKWLEQQEVLSALAAMTEDVEAVGQMGCERLSERLAFWAGTQYVIHGRRLRENKAEPEKRWKQLREFSNDVAMLRRGDQRGEWLSIERQKLALAEHESLTRFKKKVTMGLEAFKTLIENNPNATAAYAALAREMQGPFDDIPGGPDDLKTQTDEGEQKHD
jgi:hypothetical protein